MAEKSDGKVLLPMVTGLVRRDSLITEKPRLVRLPQYPGCLGNAELGPLGENVEPLKRPLKARTLPAQAPSRSTSIACSA